ncbi:microfibril-associated glycoprotein 4-like [Physella acuta]|uniref:microfibril-associated glycoprotein 4-like n=1 Tax=Physella acuta TaxID=109671 RepID=UPI0027DD5785|nr:microfibril-associated glycoprotein 4-like [Physella acuta]
MLELNSTFDDVRHFSCVSLCLRANKTCYSYMFNETSRECHLGSWVVPSRTLNSTIQGKLYSVGKYCNTNKTVSLQPDGNLSKCDICSCTGDCLSLGKLDVLGPVTSPVYESCRDVVTSDPRPVVTLTSGLVVMCDTVSDGGGWTIFQRRFSPLLSFNRGWDEYKYGFGNASMGEFYLGNENIYFLMTQKKYELRIDFTDDVNKTYVAKYSSFQILSECNNYRLLISGYSGNYRDSLPAHNNMSFSTYDRDNDISSGNCAQSFHSGFWFFNCLNANLNGVYGNWFVDGIYWDYVNKIYFTEMKMRAKI